MMAMRAWIAVIHSYVNQLGLSSNMSAAAGVSRRLAAAVVEVALAHPTAMQLGAQAHLT